MIICPNLHLPDVAREFNEIKAATSEKAAYHIWSANNGNGIDKAPNGAQSKLFNDLLRLTNGNRKEAIRLKSKIYGNSFKEWFGDWQNDPENASKIVDKNGEPLIVYHGGQKGINVFLNRDENPNYEKTKHQGYRAKDRVGIYFSEYKGVAEGYASTYKKEDREVYAVFLNIRNPLKQKMLNSKINTLLNLFRSKNKRKLTPDLIHRFELETTLKNYDGINHSNGTELIVFNSNQIKLATDNIVTSSSSTKNIYDNNIVGILLEEIDDTENIDVQDSDKDAIKSANSFIQDRDGYVIEYIQQELRNNSNADIHQLVYEAKSKFIQERQMSIMQEIQLKLAEHYGLTRNEDGTWSGKNGLVVQFMNYIEGAKGFYDHNTTSLLASHVIGLSLENADPETFNHELAHHYIRMFWNSKLVQTALAAVYKEGMTDEEVEEALVDIITARTMDAERISGFEKPSFFHKFWTKFATMLYSNFNVKNEVIRNALLNNISKSFFMNDQLQLNEQQHNLIQMANKRMFKRASYKEALSKARQVSRSNTQQTNYQAVQGDRTQHAVSTIIKGTIARNKTYRRSSTLDSKTLVAMQIQEDEVRQFAKEIEAYRDQYKRDLNSNKKLTAKQRFEMANTQQEIARNKKLIRSFVQNARDTLFDLAEKLQAAESNGYAQVLYKENVDPTTGETSIQYYDQSHINDPDIKSQVVDFQELQEMRQNTIGFYTKVFSDLKKAISHPSFSATYGNDFKNEMYQEIFGISNTPQHATIIGAVNILDTIERLYSNAILEHLVRHINKYVDENVQLNDELKERMKYSMRTWLEDQNTFGDIAAYETWIGVTSDSKSPIIRMLGDIIDNIEQEKNLKVKKKGEQLKQLRKKAMKKMTLLGIPFTNFEKALMEKTADNDFTGNFAAQINEGEYHLDRQKFLDELLYSKRGVQQKVRERIGDKKFILEIDSTGQPIFPNGCEDIETQCLHDINHWVAKHAIRQFTEAYYDKRIDMLSSTTRKAVALIDDDINKIIKACTIDGKIRTDLLPHYKHMELLRLYRQKSQLSSPFYSNGKLKEPGTNEYEIAKELTEFSNFIKGKVIYKIDREAYEEALANAKDKAQFERDNTYNVVNPDIWEAVKAMFPSISNEQLEQLIQTRRKLVSLIQARGLSYPRIDLIWNDEKGEIRPEYADFWMNLKSLDEQILQLQSEARKKKMTKHQYEAYRALLSQVAVPYNNSDGVFISWYTHIEQQVTQSIMRKYPNDPSVKDKIRQALEPFIAIEKDMDGRSISSKILSIFQMSAPSGNKVLIDGNWVDAVIKEPIQAYSKVDMENSDSVWVDQRFDQTLGKPQQPVEDKHDVYDSNGKKISYTNRSFNNHIVNGNPEIKAYYDALVDTMREAYESIPFAGKYDGRLPQIGALALQMMYRIGPRKALGYFFKRNYFVPNESDVDINSDYEVRPDGTRSMNIPVRFIRRLDDPNYINSDVFGSVMQFYEMALNYNMKVGTLPIFQTYLDKLKSNSSNNIRQRNFLKGIINRQFYDKLVSYDTDDDNTTVYNSKTAKLGLKLLPGVKALTQTGMLALNWISGLISYLDPLTSLIIEASQGKYMGWKDFMFGQYKLITNLGNAIRGAGSTRAYGKLPAAMAHFGLHNTGAEQWRNSHMTQLNRLAHSGVLMWPFALGEYTISAQTIGTMLHSYRYYEGKYYNKRQFVQYCIETGIMTPNGAAMYFNSSNMSNHTMYDAYTVNSKTGAFERKNNKYGQAITDKLELDFGKRVRNMTSNFILKVPKTEKTKIQSQILVSFIMVMRTFLLRGIGNKFKVLHDFQIDDDTIVDEELRSTESKRLKKEYHTSQGGYNFQTQEIENGTTSAALAALVTQPFAYCKYLAHVLSHPFQSRYNKNKFDKRQQLNIDESQLYATSKFLSEVGIIVLLSVLSVWWHNKIVDDDKEDTYIEKLTDLLFMRLSIERLTFVNPGTILDIITSVSASVSDIDRKLRVIDLLQDVYVGINEHGIQNYDQWDRVKSGMYKDDTKTFRNLMYTLSSLGAHNIYSSSSVEGLNARIKWFSKIQTPAKPFYHNKESQKKKKTKTKSSSGPIMPM